MPKKIDYAQRRREVTEVTRKLIVEGGIEAATMREIASAAGFANGALKHYFEGKDDIIQATFQEALAQINEHTRRRVGDKRGLEALETLMWAVMPSDEARITSARVLLSFWERAINSETMRFSYMGHLGSWRAVMRGFLQEARQQGQVTTSVADDELIEELILLNVGANVMILLNPEESTIALHRQQLEGYFRRLRQA